MIDHCIDLNTPFAKKLGFTSDKFGGYMWRVNNEIYIPLIVSLQEGKGNFRELLWNIHKKGFTIKVVEPSNRMRRIVKRLGFQPTIEDQDAEVWVL